MKTLPYLLILCFTFCSHKRAEPKIDNVVDQVQKDLKGLELKSLDYSFIKNFETIPDLKTLEKRKEVLLRLKNLLEKETEPSYRKATLIFEITTRLQRNDLETQFKMSPFPIVEAKGLHQFKNAKQWYELYTRTWSSHDWSSQEIKDFGASEVTRILAEYMKIKNRVDHSQASITNEAELVSEFKKIKDEIQKELGTIFETTKFPDHKIESMPNATEKSPPGYYDSDTRTFYYNFAGGKFRTKNLEWLYMHEAVPGHHYQQMMEEALPKNLLFKEFWFPGYVEGWGAYVENLAHHLGLYKDPQRELGKWEWDLVRSIRLLLDEGIHVQGWSQEKALAVWKKMIPVDPEIGIREIERITKWPGQVLSYKAGEKVIKELYQSCSKTHSLKQFHALILEKGPIPLPVLKDTVLKRCK